MASLTERMEPLSDGYGPLISWVGLGRIPHEFHRLLFTLSDLGDHYYTRINTVPLIQFNREHHSLPIKYREKTFKNNFKQSSS